MIPPERTFRTSDTNSIGVCQGLCASEGIRCQSFSLGISARGNGTCQLSGDRISENAGRRPRGTIYDPDFNLYQRKVNCGTDDTNDLMRPTGDQPFIFLSLNILFNRKKKKITNIFQAELRQRFHQHSQATDLHRQ